MGKLIGVDLFCGAGGMTQGAKMAGVDVRFAVEFDKHAAATYRTNHVNVDLYEDDIAKLAKIPVLKPRNTQTILFGGPPCQGFSTSNQRTRSSQNPRNWLFREFLRLAAGWEPDWIVFENVKGITERLRSAEPESEHNLPFIAHVLNDLNDIGYTPSYAVLNAANFGVPQRRARLFVVASRLGAAVSMPTDIVKKPVTVEEALCDLPSLPNGASVDHLPYLPDVIPSEYATKLRCARTDSTGHLVSRNAAYVIERYKHIPQGGNFQDIPAEMMRNYKNTQNCHTGIYHRLDLTKPSVVIGNYRKNMLIHPLQDRGLSVREAARIQSFPDNYEFRGSIGFQQQQVGNAVPPALAQAIFESLEKNDSIH